MTPVQIRAMTPDDIPAVSAVDRLAFPTPWSPRTFATEIEFANSYYLVAEVDGTIVGYIGSWMIEDEAHITTLGVHPQWRRQHIAEQLMLAVLAEARRRGIRRVTLEVRVSNSAAQNLYRKLGFQSVGIRRGYYPDNGEDALLMAISDLLAPQHQARIEAVARHVETTHAGSGNRDLV